ncbi:MAG: hypothetical protein ACU841_03285 [Gammaproteobacteria bacterium]
MSQASLFNERVLFSPNLPAAVNRLLQMGVGATHEDAERAERLFKEAQQMDRSCLQTYFALYKYYFHQGRLLEAEREVIASLWEASRQSALPGDYHQLWLEPGHWDMYASESTLFYLYSLKALAFIKLRRGYDDSARKILSLLELIDPEDRSGASVILSLAAALSEEAA